MKNMDKQRIYGGFSLRAERGWGDGRSGALAGDVGHDGLVVVRYSRALLPKLMSLELF
jgi:hypothetical protein